MNITIEEATIRKEFEKLGKQMGFDLTFSEEEKRYVDADVDARYKRYMEIAVKLQTAKNEQELREAKDQVLSKIDESLEKVQEALSKVSSQLAQHSAPTTSRDWSSEESKSTENVTPEKTEVENPYENMKFKASNTLLHRLLDRALENPIVLKILGDIASCLETEDCAQMDPQEEYGPSPYPQLIKALLEEEYRIRKLDPEIWEDWMEPRNLQMIFPHLAGKEIPQSDPIRQVQTRSEETGLWWANSLEEAFRRALADPTIWKISYTANKYNEAGELVEKYSVRLVIR